MRVQSYLLLIPVETFVLTYPFKNDPINSLLILLLENIMIIYVYLEVRL